jgi:hypothetical protein
MICSPFLMKRMTTPENPIATPKIFLFEALSCRNKSAKTKTIRGCVYVKTAPVPLL